MPIPVCMAGTRALFASIGAGVALVAAAALALLAVSAVFAFGGWSDSDSASGAKQPALVFAGSTPLKSPAPRSVPVAADTARIVAPAPTRGTDRGGGKPRSPRTRRDVVRAVQPPATSRSANDDSSTPNLDAPAAAPVVRAPSAPRVARNTGDDVRKIGDSLSSTVQSAGTALANATQPLAPPIGAVIQQALNVVGEVVRRTTDGLGATLDQLLPAK
jgi:hypothetical protein